MQHLSQTAPSPSSQIAKRRVELLFENVLVSQGFSVVNASILTWLRFEQQATEMTIWWLLVVLAVVVRLGLTRAFYRRRDWLTDRQWLRLKGAAALLSGVIWGAGAVMMLRQGSEWDIMLAAFTVAGMASAAVPLLSAQIEIYWLYSSAMLGPSVITLLLLPATRWTLTMVLMTILFWITLLASSRRFANSLLKEVEREAELAVERDRAEAASRAKSVFLANMSHEIRTPMNGLLGIAEVLKMGELDAKQSELVEVMSQSGRSMMDILNQILDFSELEGGRTVTAAMRCSPATLTRNVVQMFEATARLKGLDLHSDLSPDLPETMVAPPREIMKILTSLVGNAVKFTQNGRVELSMWGGHEMGQTDEEFTLYISVSDTGPGIALKDQERIFAAFTQVDDSATRDHGGIGLGLAMARKTAQLLGGDVTLESALGKGSRFFVFLPVRRAA
jgi:signal transduction histidine kinase